jgi:deoxyribonuclease-4
VREARLTAVVSHASYLINLASTDTNLRQQSRVAMADEIDRAEMLGLLGVVLHPGCYTSGSASAGIRLIADNLRALLDERGSGRTMVLLEHTAGQGTAVGARFEELAEIIALMEGNPRVGVCLDTCHLLASGYDIASETGYQQTFEQFGRIVGFDRLKVFHVNDSKKPLGSRVDRHEHIGKGCLGHETFRRLVNDRRFATIPMLLETPKAEGKAKGPIVVDPLDEANLETLRGLVQQPSDRPVSKSLNR